MIQCPECAFLRLSSELECPRCHHAPARDGALTLWHPEASKSGSGFQPEYFAQLAALEAGNFWFQARNKLLVHLAGKYFPDFTSFLEIGCGTGFVLSGMAQAFPGRRFSGSELFAEGLGFAQQRLPMASFHQMDACRVPFKEEFDLIGAFDVLEHIEDDQSALAGMYEALAPGGGCLITVPQHQWLWSATDESACHARRYSAQDLHAKLRKAGFSIIRSLSFVSLLLPLMLLSRRKKRAPGAQADSGDELRLSAPLNNALGACLSFERLLIQAGVNFPCGGSRVVIARRGNAG